jgi:signal transduction histidine kinase
MTSQLDFETGGGRLCILIADDDVGDRRLIARVLAQAKFDCDCVEAASIEDALELSEGRTIHCAIVDYRMPGRDGLHGVGALHERFPLMSIIMATGQGDEAVATEAMKRGALDYIAKSQINAQSLRRCIKGALQKGALLRKVAQQREELETFASVLAHDLSAPIASMQLFASAIVEELEGFDIPPEVVEYCGQVVDAGRRANKLIETLHAYTKADARVEFETVDMEDVLRSALANLRTVIDQRRARVTHGRLPAVVGNTPQLTQLMQNLIGNAMKYCKDVPQVDITARPDREGSWLFSVTDNGIGIAAKDYQRVFEPFRRLHGVGEYEGTGLGLAICRRLVERHGGIIGCESKGLGRGTTFYFTLRGAPAALVAQAS